MGITNSNNRKEISNLKETHKCNVPICSKLTNSNTNIENESNEIIFANTYSYPKGTFTSESTQFFSQSEKDLFYFSQGENIAAVRFLTIKGVHISILDQDRTSPLHISCNSGSLQMVEEVLNQGASVNLPDIVGWTGLHVACYKRRSEVILLLLKYGANLNAKDRDGLFPLDLINKDQNCLHVINNFIIHSTISQELKATSLVQEIEIKEKKQNEENQRIKKISITSVKNRVNFLDKNINTVNSANRRCSKLVNNLKFDKRVTVSHSSFLKEEILDREEEEKIREDQKKILDKYKVIPKKHKFYYMNKEKNYKERNRLAQNLNEELKSDNNHLTGPGSFRENGKNNEKFNMIRSHTSEKKEKSNNNFNQAPQSSLNQKNSGCGLIKKPKSLNTRISIKALKENVNNSKNYPNGFLSNLNTEMINSARSNKYSFYETEQIKKNKFLIYDSEEENEKNLKSQESKDYTNNNKNKLYGSYDNSANFPKSNELFTYYKQLATLENIDSDVEKYKIYDSRTVDDDSFLLDTSMIKETKAIKKNSEKNRDSILRRKKNISFVEKVNNDHESGDEDPTVLLEDDCREDSIVFSEQYAVVQQIQSKMFKNKIQDLLSNKNFIISRDPDTEYYLKKLSLLNIFKNVFGLSIEEIKSLLASLFQIDSMFGLYLALNVFESQNDYLKLIKNIKEMKKDDISKKIFFGMMTSESKTDDDVCRGVKEKLKDFFFDSLNYKNFKESILTSFKCNNKIYFRFLFEV
jgi:ankyrin repeat protein